MALKRHTARCIISLAAQIEGGANPESCHPAEPVAVMLAADIQAGHNPAGVGRRHSLDNPQSVISNPEPHDGDALLAQSREKDADSFNRFVHQRRQVTLPQEPDD
jgi:hypothetical protein